jgi:hypothetical protein
MQRPNLAQATKPLALFALLAGMLLLSIDQVAWATPTQSTAGQTVPTATPGGATDRTPTPTSAGCPPAVTSPKAPPSGPTKVIGPGCGATISLGDVTVTISNNGLGFPGTLEVAPVMRQALPVANTGITLFGEPVMLTLSDASGNVSNKAVFANSAQVCFNYTAADLAAVGGDPKNFLVQYYDTSLSPEAWVSLAGTADASNSRVCAATTHAGMFALAGKAGAANPEALPVAGGPAVGNADPAQSSIPWWSWLLIAPLAILVALFIIFFSRRKRPSTTS